MLQRLRETWYLICSRTFAYYFTWKTATLVFVYLSFWAFFQEDALPPDGNMFHMFMLFLVSHFMGKLAFVLNLPPLLGMLLAGFIYGNLVELNLEKEMVGIIRELALMIILVRAGLHLDPASIKKMSFACFRLAFIPCIVELATAAGCVYFFFGLNLAWSLMVGFILAASSPAVVVPGCIKLKQAGYGVAKGIPTLIIAAASIDDVFSITGFSICLGFAFVNPNQDPSNAWSLTKSILKGPFEVVVGILYGVVVGVLLWYIPEPCVSSSKTNMNSRFDIHRFVLLLIASLGGIFGFKSLEMEAAGSLAVLVAPFVAALRWRRLRAEEFHERGMKTIWTIIQHYLFCLIGADMRVSTLEPDMILFGLLSLVLAVVLRTITAYYVIYGVGLTSREKLFTALAWMAKATVQAALGPVALNSATNDTETRNGKVILTIAALSIILTAPIGAIVIEILGPRWLSNSDIETDDKSSTYSTSSSCSSSSCSGSVKIDFDNGDPFDLDYNHNLTNNNHKSKHSPTPELPNGNGTVVQSES